MRTQTAVIKTHLAESQVKKIKGISSSSEECAKLLAVIAGLFGGDVQVFTGDEDYILVKPKSQRAKRAVH